MYRVLIYSLPAPLLGSLLLLLARSLNVLVLPPLLPGALPPSPHQLARKLESSTVVLSASPDDRVTYQNLVKTFQPHFKILALRHPAHASVELGAANIRHGLFHPTRLEEFDTVFRRRRGMFDETIALETLATNRREPVRFLKRCGFSASQSADMVRMESRSPSLVQKHSLFLCGPWCRNRTATSWSMAPLRPFSRGSFLSTERSIRAHPLPTAALFAQARRLAPSLAAYYPTIFPGERKDPHFMLSSDLYEG